MHTLEQRNEISAADDLHESMSKLEMHLSTQLMTAVANISDNNATKRSDRGGTDGDN